MKVYSTPDDLPFNAPSFDAGADVYFELSEQAEKTHRKALKEKMIEYGYIGKKTGHELHRLHGDSYAAYMFVDARGSGMGVKSFLIHLPYGDAHHDPDVQYLPQYEVERRLIDPEKHMDMFS